MLWFMVIGDGRMRHVSHFSTILDEEVRKPVYSSQLSQRLGWTVKRRMREQRFKNRIEMAGQTGLNRNRQLSAAR